MFKLLRQIICLVVIAVILFIFLFIMSGGEKFRWFGKTVNEQSEKLGEEADKMKEKTDSVTRGIEKTKEAINDIIGKKRGKSD